VRAELEGSGSRDVARGADIWSHSYVVVWEACRAYSGRAAECIRGPPSRTRRLSLSVCTFATLAVVAVATPTAYARNVHAYESVITEVPATGPGGSVTAPGRLEGVDSMTVHSGDLYVAEHLPVEVAGHHARTDQWALSVSKPGEYEFLAQLPPQPEPQLNRAHGIALGAAGAEPDMYIGQGGFGSAPGVNVFATGGCGNLECASLQTLWTGEGAPNPPFASVGSPFRDAAGGVAVDHSAATGENWASGDVFVADEANEAVVHNVVDIFETEAGGTEHFVTQVTGVSGPIAVSGLNGDLVVGDKVLHPEVEGPKTGKYESSCQLVPPGGPLGGANNTVEAVAVDDSTEAPYAGEIYVATRSAVYEFDPKCGFRGEITGVPKEGVPGGVKGDTKEVPFNELTAHPVSLAVDPGSHRVFVGLTASGAGGAVDVLGPDLVVPDVVTEAPSNLTLDTDPATGITSWRIDATGSVNPLGEGAASCWFVWGLSDVFGREATCSAPVPDGGAPVGVNGSLSGLEPDIAYLYRLQAKNEHGTNPGEESEDYRFTTPGPGLRSESVSDVSASGASFEATLAPHDVPVEERDFQAATSSPTTYYFQYSTQPTSVCVAEPTACEKIPSAPASAGSGAADVSVSQPVTGLAPNTSYHYRLVAINEALPLSQPGVLTPFYGPDRTFTTQGPGGPVVLPDGRAWELVSPADKHGAQILPSGQASTDGSSFTFQTNVPTEPEPKGAGAHGLQVLSSRVASGQWSSVDINLSRSSPEGVNATETSPYRYFSPDLGSSFVESEGPFSIPEGSHQNERGEWEQIVEASPVPTERTPYLRRNSTCAVAPATCFEPLLVSEDVTSGEKIEGKADGDFGAANFVGATPDARHALIASSVRLTSTPTNNGGLYEWSAGKPPAERLSLVNVVPETGEPGPQFVAGLSPDGSRVLFAACAPGIKKCGAFYVHDVAGGETARLDLTENGSLPPAGPSEFGGASTDLSKVFFFDTAKLTNDSGADGADLYACDLGPEGAGAPRCALTDLTSVPAAGQPGAHEDAQVSRVLGVSPDGSYVYFLAQGVQAAGATPGEGERENVYVAHDQAGKWVTSFIASPAGVGPESVISPDGSRLAFSSSSSLTGYDNRDAKTGAADSEVYLYDTSTSTLVCASCNPSGARPTGQALVPVSAHRIRQNGFFPVWQQEPGARSLFDDGRLFFNSGDALVPQDTNGNVDVYEFEPAGVGSCTAADPTFNPAGGDCVSLISSGRAAGESTFLEASANASDVFFTTEERLLPRKDTDTAVDVYDAHECTSASPCAPEASAQEECTSAAACRPAPVPQPSIFGPPSSATFSGLGNIVPEAPGSGPPPKQKTAAQIRKERLAKALKACKKKHGPRRRACERKAHVRYGPPKSRRASAKRRRAPTSSSRTGG